MNGQWSSTSHSLPVFVFPSCLQFVSDDSASHKQVLTIYNPYEFVIVYKVLCTAPTKYSVVEPEGSLREKCCIDIVIRHLSPTVKSNFDQTDKFRVQVTKHGDRETQGRKDVESVLYPSRRDCPESSRADSAFSRPNRLRTPSTSSITPRTPYPLVAHGGVAHANPQQQHQTSMTILSVLVGVLCICALSVPTYCPPDTTTGGGSTSGNLDHDGSLISLPQWIQLSVTQKVTAAYVLGLVTVLLVRT